MVGAGVLRIYWLQPDLESGHTSALPPNNQRALDHPGTLGALDHQAVPLGPGSTDFNQTLTGGTLVPCRPTTNGPWTTPVPLGPWTIKQYHWGPGSTDFNQTLRVGTLVPCRQTTNGPWTTPVPSGPWTIGSLNPSLQLGPWIYQLQPDLEIRHENKTLWAIQSCSNPHYQFIH